MVHLVTLSLAYLQPVLLKKPSWLDTRIAGYALIYDQTHSQKSVYDTKSGYYLARRVDCDGAHLDLLLTRDRHLLGDPDSPVQVVKAKSKNDDGMNFAETTFPSLSTGKGVHIGDTLQQVQKKLGKATHAKPTGARKQFFELVYFWSDVKKGEGYEWTNTYTFKKNKLIEIDFHREQVPGC